MTARRPDPLVSATAWIHRRAEVGGFGATQVVEEPPEVDFYFTSLGQMADAHRREMAGAVDGEETAS